MHRSNSAAAFHEAGHAVIDDLTGRRVEWLSIEASGSIGGLCYSVPRGAPPLPEAGFDWMRSELSTGPATSESFDPELLPRGVDAEAALLQRLAGPVAQRIGTKAATVDWRGGANDLLYVLALLEREAPEHEQASKLYAAIGRTDALLRERWTEVEAIAAALWIRQRLNSAEVAEILSRVRAQQEAK